MTFTPKSWGDFSTGGTPLSAAALIDLETRLAAYVDAIKLTLDIVNTTTGAALLIQQNANASASVSTGGAVNLDNSGSTGAGVVIYSTQASPAGRLLVVNANNAAFNQSAVRVQHAGSGTALDVAASGTGAGITTRVTATPTATTHALSAIIDATLGTTASAGNFVSSNAEASCLQVSGSETGRGSIKVTHTGPGTSADANASALSIDLQGANTAAQGIHIDSVAVGTTGALLDIRNNGNQLVKVLSDATFAIPMLVLGNSGPQITIGTGAPAVSAPVGSLYLRTDGGPGTALYRKESGTGSSGWVSEAQVTTTTQPADYTLALADAGTVVEGTKASPQVITVPPNSSVAFPVGTVIEVVQYGAGQITLTPGSGVTIRTPSSLTTRTQYSTVGIRKRGTDEWVASGDLT